MSNKPKIRFKGFTDDWEQRKLGEVATFRQGYQVDVDFQKSKMGINDVRFIRIVDYTQNTTDVRYINNDPSLSKVDVNDVIMVRYGASAGFVGTGIAGVLANNMFTITPIDTSINKRYLYIFLKKDEIFELLNTSNTSSAMPALNFSMLNNIVINYPSDNEQEIISSVILSIDKLITLHQRKLDKLKNIKKSLLENMFPKDNEKAPKIRFKGFTDDWEQRKFDDFCMYHNGKAHESCISKRGKYIVVNSKFCSTDGKVKKYSNLQLSPLYKDDIAFVLSDVPNGKALARTYLIRHNNRYSLNQRIACFSPKDKKVSYYLSTIFNRNGYFLRFGDGAKQTNLSVNDVKNFETLLPSINEQIVIGKVFEKLENLITLHQRKCEKLKKIKKSLLENMFV